MGALSHIDLVALEHQLHDAVAGSQEVRVSEHWVPFGNCAHCVAGYTK